MPCQARNLFKQAAEVVARYAEMAQQVSNTVLPDLQLAVDEQVALSVPSASWHMVGQRCEPASATIECWFLQVLTSEAWLDGQLGHVAA